MTIGRTLVVGSCGKPRRLSGEGNHVGDLPKSLEPRWGYPWLCGPRSKRGWDEHPRWRSHCQRVPKERGERAMVVVAAEMTALKETLGERVACPRCSCPRTTSLVAMLQDETVSLKMASPSWLIERVAHGVERRWESMICMNAME